MLALPPAAVSCGTPGAALQSQAEVIAADVYHTVDRVVTIPVDAAKPYVIRLALQRWLGGIDLPDDVRARIVERIDEDDFVDEVVSLVFWLQGIYSMPWDGMRFAEHARATYADRRDLPGIEHSLFELAPPVKEAEESSGGVDPRILSAILRAYDAIFLRSRDGAKLRFDAVDLDAVVERTIPVVRDLLSAVRDGMPEDSETGGFVDKVIDDREILEAVTVSVVEFIRDFALEGHRRFARHLQRKEELRRWMLAELEEDGFGRLPAWLRLASRERRYGVLVVVDGLQGHLLESLARGDADSPFLQRVVEEERAIAKTSTPEKAARIGFLEHIAAHGFRDPAYLPFVRRLYEPPAAGIARTGISTTPTISVRNVPIAQTGAATAGPHGTGLPNFHFLDREADRAWYFYGSDGLRLGALARQAGMHTLWTRLEHELSFVVGSFFDAGSHVAIDSYICTALGEKQRDFAEAILLAQLEKRAETETEVRGLRARLLEVLDAHERTSAIRFLARAAHRRRASQLVDRIAELEDEGMPRILVYYNPWPDHFAHYKGPFSDEIIGPTGELNRLDYWLGKIEETYRRAGIHSRTLFGMAGDHGLASAGRFVDVAFAVFGSLAAEGKPFIVEKLSVEEGEPPRITNPRKPPSMRGRDVVLSATAGGNCTLDFFLDQGERWRAQPVLDDLRALRTLAGHEVDIVEESRKRLGDALDYLVVRETPCGLDGGAVRLISSRDGELAETRVVRRGQRIYCDFEQDILELTRLSPYSPEPPAAERALHADLVARARAAREEDESTWLTEREWRELCRFTPRPDSVVQIAHIYDTDRAGTVNLFPAAGVAFHSTVHGRHAGELFHEKDAFVGVWGEPVTRQERLAAAVNGSAAATIYAYLTGETISAGEDGWGFEPIAIGAEEETRSGAPSR